MGSIRILFLGDIVGEPGRKTVIDQLHDLKEEFNIDFAVVNGENSAGGRGITPKIVINLLRAGAAVITTGDHAWDQKEIVDHFPSEPRLLRPLNYPPGTPGQGSIVLDTAKGKIAVMQAQGRTFMQPLDNPFPAAEIEIEKLHRETNIILVDFHAEATSEKVAFGRFLDGKVSAVIGTHTHVQTSEETVLPKGTAFLCDAGMCGPVESVIGGDIGASVKRFRTNMPQRFPIARGPVKLCGAVVAIDSVTGRASAIERFHRIYDN